MVQEEKINILVVDDVPEKLLALRAILEELGQNVVTASSGREALRRLLQEEFAVVLLDVNMPGMDGFETAALIRQRKKNESTPVIFITAYGDETHAWQGYSLGAVDYILAPVIPEVLRAKVSVFVELYKKNRQVQRQAEERVVLVQEQAARRAAEEELRRSNFLAEASHVLARSFDGQATLSGLLRLLVPALADFAAVCHLDPAARGPTLEAAWLDPTTAHPVQAALGRPQLPPLLEQAIDRVLATGCREDLSQIGPWNPAVPDDLDEPGLAESLPVALESAIVVPLLARGRTLGALVLAMNGSGCSFGPAEWNLAEDLAGRAGVALDNGRLYREIQEGDRRKDEFLAMLGHELRNPLAAIANALQYLAMLDRADADFDVAHDILRRQVQQMTRLVDDLLDVSRITRGKVELRKEPLELSDLVARAVEATEPSILARGHRLSVSLPPGPVYLHADPARLEQVLANLLNNAAKYTPPGGQVWLSASCEAEQAVVRVRDNGIGIPPNLLPTVFELFIQGDRSLDRSQGGLGIGLTLVQRLVEMHGGQVQAKSEGIGKGAEFIVRLPISAAASHPAAEIPAGRPDEKASGGQRVLLVEDNADLLTTTSHLLRKLGYQVETAQDGLSALDVARRMRPEVMLIDIGLPGMNGYEVARHLRQEGSFHELLLVAMTGYGQSEDRRRSEAAGFDYHLVKPVSVQALREVLAGVAPRLVESCSPGGAR